MKKLALLLLAVIGLVSAGGCSSPGYSADENVGRVLRTWEYERAQMVEDIMYEAMWNPASHSTLWNLR
jgi:hypothetical protein